MPRPGGRRGVGWGAVRGPALVAGGLPRTEHHWSPNKGRSPSRAREGPFRAGTELRSLAPVQRHPPPARRHSQGLPSSPGSPGRKTTHSEQKTGSPETSLGLTDVGTSRGGHQSGCPELPETRTMLSTLRHARGGSGGSLTTGEKVSEAPTQTWKRSKRKQETESQTLERTVAQTGTWGPRGDGAGRGGGARQKVFEDVRAANLPREQQTAEKTGRTRQWGRAGNTTYTPRATHTQAVHTWARRAHGKVLMAHAGTGACDEGEGHRQRGPAAGAHREKG